jgi:peroxiredoxin
MARARYTKLEMNPVRSWWGIVLLLFTAATVAIHYQAKVRMHASSGTGSVAALGKLKVGDAAPDFSLPDLAGEPVSLASYRGRKVVVLDFWATWCGPCRMAMPGLQALSDDMKDQGVVLVSVNEAERAEQVRAFIERKKYTFRTVLDADRDVGHRYGVRALPTMVVIDKQGTVRRLSVGYSDDKELRKILAILAAES